MSMKNSNDTIGNRSRDLPVCSAVPQPLRHRVPPTEMTEGKTISLQAWTGPEGSRRLRLPDFKTMGTWKWQCCQRYAPASFTPGNIAGTHYCWRLNQPQGHSAAGRIMSINANDTIGNRFRDLPICSVVPHPLRHRVPHTFVVVFIINVKSRIVCNSVYHTVASPLNPEECVRACVCVLCFPYGDSG
jgi:hypothetical protein